jgi:hypothetical protein
MKDLLLSKLWSSIKHNPSAKNSCFAGAKWRKIENDHIAIRTYNDERVNIAVLEKPFVKQVMLPKDTFRIKIVR